MRWAAIGALVVLLAGVPACGHAPARDAAPPAPAEYLDDGTGATITAVDRPLVFAIERSDVAANLRDYLTLAAAAVDRSGKIQYVLVAYRWSTLDTHAAAAAGTAPATLVLAADDRRVRLDGNGRTPHDMGVDRLIHPPPNVKAAPVVVSSDLDMIRVIAHARRLSVQIDPDAAAPRYELWDDQRPAWQDFVRYLGGER